MRLGSALLSAVCLLLVGSGRAQDGGKQDDELAKKDLAALQGSWTIVGKEYMGKKATAEEIAELTGVMVIKGNTITQWNEEMGKKVVISEASVKLNAAAKPKAFDLTYTGGMLKEKTVLGIYEVEGDSLKACFSFDEQIRPKEFTSKGSSGALVMTYKRVSK
jgi:uncharacterized protein (TIGR03067 family)